MASIPSFIFGGNTKYKTQEELEAAREQVRALLGDIGQSGLTGWGSALADLGKGIGARIEQGRINEGQEGLEAAQGPFSQTLAEIAAGYGGGGGVGDIATAGGSDTAAGGGAQDAFFANPGGGVGGVDSYLANIRSAESGGNDNAKNPRSSASGRYQFTRGTWDNMIRTHPELGLTRDGMFDAAQQERAIRAFTADNARVLSGAGIPITGGTLYGAHFLGAGGAKQAFRNPDDARMSSVVGPGVVRANPFLSGMTVGDFKRWTAKKGGGGKIADLSGGGGSDAQAGGGKEDSFLQAKPNRRRMTPAMLEQEAGTEARPIWDNGFSLGGRRRMTPAMTGIPDAVQPAAPPAPAPSPLDDRRRMTPAMTGIPDVAPAEAPSPLDGRRRMTPAMINPAAAPAPAPMPAPDPARFGPTPPVPVAAPLPQPQPARFGGPTPFVPPAPQIFTPPAAPRGNRLGSPPPSMAGTETAPYPVPGNSMAGTETAPPQFAPTPAQPPVPTARPAVDPFTDMILGDKASQFRPGNVSATPPAETARGLAAARQLTPFGANVFPAVPPAPGTPAAAGFGVPQQAMAGGGGSNTLAGQGGGAFPPAPPAPGQQRSGGPQNVIGKLMTILASPYASDEQKRMAAAMLDREYALEDERRKAASPEALLDFQYKQAQLADLQRDKTAKPLTAEERKFWGIPDSDTRPYMLTEKGPEPIGGAGAASHTVTPMTAEDRQRFGIPDSDKRPYMLYDGKPELVGGAQAAGGGGVAKKSLVPILMQRKDGTRYLAQPDEEGKILPSQVNEGDTPVDPSDKSYLTAFGKELGENEAKRLLASEQSISSAVQAQDLLKDIRDDPYLSTATGASSFFNRFWGTGGYDFENKVKQAKSGAFLTAIPQLQGFGALSNTEGAVATAALNRLDTATSEVEFKKALTDYENIVKLGLERAQQKIMGGMGQTPSQRGVATGTSGTVEYDYDANGNLVERQR